MHNLLHKDLCFITVYLFISKTHPFGHKGEKTQDYYDMTDKVVRHMVVIIYKMERSPHWNRIQDVVTSRQIIKAGKVISIESLREAIEVQDPKPFVLHINQFILLFILHTN